MTSNYRLGVERAAHELEWMARGWTAWLSLYMIDAAKKVRLLPDRPHMPYEHAFIDAIFVVRREAANALDVENVRIAFNQMVARLAEIPIDPADDPYCQRKDGAVPTTSRKYAHG